MNRNTRGRIFRFLLVVIFISGLSLSAWPEAVRAKTAEAGPAASPATAAGRPLAELLDEDGTLDLASGYRGSIDPSGWRLASAEGEPPRFAPQAAEDHWASGFHLPGINGSVYALAVDGSGNLYAGGEFTTAGSIPANCVARWDGSDWSPLGSGMSGGTSDTVVYALAVDGNGNLYAGGHFWTAGGTSANYVARWDGTTWNALGSGMDDPFNETWVRALAVDANGNLYAGGGFTSAGDIPANYIARWDGSSWSPLDSGMNYSGYVNALVVDGNGDLYAGGKFTTAGGNPANRIARWDGTTWSALDSGMNNTVYELAVDGSGSLYAGGSFTTAGGAPTNYIAHWDGSTWSALGLGMNDGFYITSVHALAVDGSGNLYAGGDFTTAGGNPANNIARWNGSSWSPLGSGMSGGLYVTSVYALATNSSGDLYAGGSFTTAGGTSVSHIARWDGMAWGAMPGSGNGMNHTVRALVADGSGNLYAGGIFTIAGGTPANYIARWDGSDWSPLGSGMDNYVYALAMDGSGNLYAGGWFTTAGGISASNIARWDGTAWSPLGSGTNHYVYALAADGSGNLYAGGWFTSAGGISANHIARWDGSAWSALGAGINGWVEALTMDDSGNLYAGGQFTSAGGNSANNIARWNGMTWSSFGSGMSSGVKALVVDNSGDLYAGGYFISAGGLRVNHIARWDGTAWSALGSGVGGSPRALLVGGSGVLYTGGGFTVAGNKASNGIARWGNQPPTADDDNYTVAEDSASNSLDVLNGDADPDGDVLSIFAIGVPDQGGTAANGGTVITYTPAANFYGIEIFTYTVSDGYEGFDTAIVTITVDPVNDAPLPDAGADQVADEGQVVQFSGSYTDPGRQLSVVTASAIAWNFGDGVTATGTLTPSHAYADDGTYAVTLTVDDGEGGVASDTLLVTVDNVAPALAPIADQSVVAGVILTVTASYTDPGQSDTFTAVIAWGDGITETINLAAGTQVVPLEHTYDTAGTYTASVTLTDDDGGQDAATFTVEVTPAGFTTFLPVIRR